MIFTEKEKQRLLKDSPKEVRIRFKPENPNISIYLPDRYLVSWKNGKGYKFIYIPKFINDKLVTVEDIIQELKQILPDIKIKM